MRVLVLGVALLCVCQVRGDGDLLRSLLDEKVKELKEQKAEPTIFLAADTPSKDPAKKDPAVNCDAMDVVTNANQLIKNTLDIGAKTFNVVYTFMYPSSGQKDCSSIGGFRCFFKEFNDVKDNIQTVKNNIMNYKDNAAGLVDGINYYMQNCMVKK